MHISLSSIASHLLNRLITFLKRQIVYTADATISQYHDTTPHVSGQVRKSAVCLKLTSNCTSYITRHSLLSQSHIACKLELALFLADLFVRSTVITASRQLPTTVDQ